MNALRKLALLLRAVSRLTPVMMVFMARRLLRNRLVPLFPAAYRRRLAAIEQALPDLDRRDAPTAGVSAMAAFYGAEYRDQIDAARTGRIRLHGREIDFGAPSDIVWTIHLPDEGDHQMWRVKLAHMGFLCPLLAEGGPEDHLAAAAIISSFRDGAAVTAPGAFSGTWFPYAASHRILAVGSGLIEARRRGTLAPDIDALVAGFLKENVAFLIDNVEHELCNNHVERNLAALCLYFTHVDTPPSWIVKRLEREVAHLTTRTILADGVQIERSPMYQGLSVASLAVMADTPFLSSGLRADLARKSEAARLAFAVLCHPDGEVALFNDSWHGEVPHWTGAPAPDGRSILSAAGYARLSEGDDMCLLDGGALGPRWNPGHGHADFLAVEITLAGRRLIVDPGTSRYNTGPDRARERSAAAHNGPTWLGHEPVQFLGCFKVGRVAEALLIPESQLPPLTVGGVLQNGPGTVARAVRHFPGEGFLIVDTWSRSHPPGQVSWLLPDDWRIDTDTGLFDLHHTDGARGVIQCLSDIEPVLPQRSLCATHYGSAEPAWELVLKPPAAGASRHLMCWIGHQSAPPAALAEGHELLRLLASSVAAS